MSEEWWANVPVDLLLNLIKTGPTTLLTQDQFRDLVDNWVEIVDAARNRGELPPDDPTRRRQVCLTCVRVIRTQEPLVCECGWWFCGWAHIADHMRQNKDGHSHNSQGRLMAGAQYLQDGWHVKPNP